MKNNNSNILINNNNNDEDNLLRGPISSPPKPQTLLQKTFRKLMYPISKLVGILCIIGFMITATIEQMISGDSLSYILMTKLGRPPPPPSSTIVRVQQIQDKPSSTAKLVAMTRRMCCDLGISDDYLAKYVIPDFSIQIYIWSLQFRRWIEGENVLLDMFVGYRTEFLDRLVRNAKPKQVVILAAGYCSRAYRGVVVQPHQDQQQQIRFYEVDIATTQAVKKKLIAKHPNEFKPKPSTSIEYITVDFSQEKFIDQLIRHGFNNKETKTVVTIEGLLYYLTWPQIEDMMIQIHNGMAKGTLIGLDLFVDTWSTPERLALADPRRRAAIALVKHFGESFKWGLDPTRNETPKDVFEKLGFKVIIDLDRLEIQDKLGKARCEWIGGRATLIQEKDKGLVRFVVLEVV
jgi:methyltransferase (TIGR00027 family)